MMFMIIFNLKILLNELIYLRDKIFGILSDSFHYKTRDSYIKDYTSVDLWIKSMSKRGSESSVSWALMIYKPQGIDNISGVFQNRDFLLVLITNFQATMLQKFGCDKMCVNFTHVTNVYEFLLTTILTVDEQLAGVPMAFLISNNTTTITLTHFFNIGLIKERAGSIVAIIFMTDDASKFINAWTAVMEPPVYHLLCTWHVVQN